MRKHDAGDHRIAQIARPALLVTGCHQVSCLLRGGDIEGNNSAVNLVKKPIESLDQSGSPPSGGYDLQSELHFKNSD